VRTPYETFQWICQSFPYPRPEEQESLDMLICHLALAHIQTVVWRTRKRILIFTWIKPQTA
jgi:hypothetical protein